MSIYTGFTPDDIVEANPTVVTTGLWSNDTGSYETAFFVNTKTGQQVGTSAEYYLDLFGANPTSNTLAEVQFSIAYGHINGGGAPTLTDNELATLPTKVIYSQYKNLLSIVLHEIRHSIDPRFNNEALLKKYYLDY